MFRSLLLALATVPAGAALAGDLDGQTAEVVAGDPTEAWSLINGSRLTVSGGQTQRIAAHDTSQVLLDGAQVTRTGTEADAIRLTGQASLSARNSQINGEIAVYGESSSLLLENSVVLVNASNTTNPVKSVGVDLGPGQGAIRRARPTRGSTARSSGSVISQARIRRVTAGWVSA
ncbi:hypothetical protein [Stenotrophomonas indicatrix]|uniref:hypothetical protein n=1 Tax=Stenotrophomonas indicatrix TaxID=2045451 RepID=UPI003D8155B6